jgi:hypothetical protein
MIRSSFRWLPLAGVLLAVPVAALSAPDKASPEKLRADPDRYARLRRSFAEFQALPPTRQAQLRTLDRQLHELDAAKQEHLLGVAKRYADWLDQLPETDRARFAAAPNGDARLKVVRQIREQQWLARAPAAVRTQYQAIPDEAARSAQVSKWVKEEREQREAWAASQKAAEELRREMPVIAKLLEENKAQVSEYLGNLRPRLTAEEKGRLAQAEADRAEGEPPGEFARLLLELGDKHPIFLDPLGEPKHFDELPHEVQKFLKEKDPHLAKPKAFKEEGRWPDYPIAVSELAKSRGWVLPKQLGPSKPTDFPKSVQPALETLYTKARPQDKKRLMKAEGHWPDYPRVVAEVCRSENSHLTGYMLPGRPERWDAIRKKMGL